MAKEGELKRLQYYGEGRLTLEGKLVKVTKIGFPIMAFFPGKFKGDGRMIFDERSCPGLSTNASNAVYRAKAGTIAYALAIGERPIQIEQDTEYNRVHIRKWTAVQFYRIINKKKKK